MLHLQKDDFFITKFCGKQEKEMLELILEEYNAEQEEQPSEVEESRELIKGVKGLAEFLGCGVTKAQNIMNSGVLQERDIAYRAGNRWRFDKNLLNRLLKDDPEVLNGLYSEVA